MVMASIAPHEKKKGRFPERGVRANPKSLYQNSQVLRRGQTVFLHVYRKEIMKENKAQKSLWVAQIYFFTIPIAKFHIVIKCE